MSNPTIKCAWCRRRTWPHRNEDGTPGQLYGYCSSTCKKRMEAPGSIGFAVRIEDKGVVRDAFTGATDSGNVREYRRTRSRP